MHLAKQQHLNHIDRVNLGAYYTPESLVNQVWKIIKPYIESKTTILDTSCGYGGFLKHPHTGKKIGNDIDIVAVDKAKENTGSSLFNYNGLHQVSRSAYGINSSDKLCIIGNPPYNDRTSIIREHIKSNAMAIDADIKTRDLGMSFLLSYDKLDADLVCVLHPLSYLIKSANFKALNKFSQKYKLLQGHIISSACFSQASKAMNFPIVIALYQKDKIGTSYADIVDFAWQIEDKSFKLNSFNDISNYIKKYPSKHQQAKKDDLLFWTMRDINALKRNQTFVKKLGTNTLIIDKSKLEYYIYVDVFKQFSRHIPYYFGNCNVLIDNELFQQYKKYFILEALSRHHYLRQYFAPFDSESLNNVKYQIMKYFQQLLGGHYVDKVKSRTNKRAI